MKKITTTFFLLCLGIALQAQQSTAGKKPLRFLMGVALELGGDDVASVYFEDGSTQNMHAGQGGTLFAGGQLRLNEAETFFLRGSIGIKYLTTKADNAHIRLTRIPLQLSVNYYPLKKFRLAAGVVSHQSIRLNFDGIGVNEKFTSTPGPILEVGYGVFGLSYTVMTYQDRNKASYRANAIGLTVSGVL